MNNNNFNPSGGSNHYHLYPVNHYNYFYNYPNIVNNNNNRQPEYSQNIQIQPPRPASPSSSFFNSSVMTGQTSKGNTVWGNSQISSQNPSLGSQIFNPGAWPQNSFVGNEVSRSIQQNSFSGGNFSSYNSTQQSNSATQNPWNVQPASGWNNCSPNNQSDSRNRMSSPHGQNFDEQPNAPMQTPRYVCPTENDATWNDSMTRLWSKPGGSSSSFVQHQENQTNDTNRNNGNLNSNSGRTTASVQGNNNGNQGGAPITSRMFALVNKSVSKTRKKITKFNYFSGDLPSIGVNNRSTRNMFLHFNVEETFSNKAKFIIREQEKANYAKKTEFVTKFVAAVLKSFCRDIDMWLIWDSPTAEELMNIARTALLVTHKYGVESLTALQGIICRRLQGSLVTWQGETIIERMTLLYLVNLIVETEDVNPDLRTGGEKAWSKMFEWLISFEDNFRNLVREASLEQKRQLFTLRCKWSSYVSVNTLRQVDGSNFWISQGQDTKMLPAYNNLSRSTNLQENKDKVAISFLKDAIEIEKEDKNYDADNLGSFIQVIDQILHFGWLLEFPIGETDKQRFTEKYSVEKPTGKDSVYIYDRNVDFNINKFKDSLVRLFAVPEKRKMIDQVKEMFYIEKVFGTHKNKSVTDLLIALMSDGKSALSLLERWICVLLIHIVLSAEATQSSTKKQPKEDRPFCKAFSIKAFVTTFREFVGCIKSRRSKQKLYWMRLIWNSCLLEESLSDIDKNNFWANKGVRTSTLPAKLSLRRPNIVEVPDNDDDHDEIAVVADIDKNELREEVATIVLLSSEDEGDNPELVIVEHSGEAIGGTLNNSSVNTEQSIPNRKKKKNKNEWYEEFLKSRRAWWARVVSTNAENLVVAKERYCIHNNSGSVTAFKAAELNSAMEKFQHTVLGVVKTMPLRDSNDLFLAAQEALFLAEELGDDAVLHIAAFLDKGLRNGFDTESATVKLLSRFIAFLIIHVIIAFEEVEQSIGLCSNTKQFSCTFQQKNVAITAKSLSLHINDECTAQKLQCLLKMCLPCEVNTSLFSNHIRKSLNNKEDLEADFWKDIYDYTVEKAIHEQRLAKDVREIPIAGKRKSEETEVSSKEKENRSDSVTYSPEAENVLDKDSVESIRCDLKNIANSSKRRLVVKETKGKSKVTENLQTACIPVTAKTVPLTMNKTSKISTAVSIENQSKTHCESRTSSSSTISSKLLVINDKLQLSCEESSKENLKKMLRECFEKYKKSKEANDSVPSSSTSSARQVIENVEGRLH